MRNVRDVRTCGPYSNGTELLYLCGHSLGLMPLAARRLVDQELDDWARLAVLGHEHATRPVDSLPRKPDSRTRVPVRRAG